MNRMGYLSGYVGFLGLMGAASPFSPKIRRAIGERKGLVKRLRAKNLTGVYWFHVASSGELEQCLPIVDELKTRKPDAKIFLSYFSPTAKRAIELEVQRRQKQGRAVTWDYADYSPYDLPGSVQKALDILKPKAFVAIHREIWPTLIEECEARNIPTFLFASYIPESALGKLKRFRPWLERFQEIGVTEPHSAKLLSEFLKKDCRVVGDPRIERVLARKTVIASEAKQSPNRSVLILASLWKKDFQALQPGVHALIASHPEWQVIVVPHEPTERMVTYSLEWFREIGVNAELYSQSAEKKAHLVVDSVGMLAELYREATLVFVGGSFRNRVHNVLEPAAYGKPILTGPFIENSGEAMELWQKESGLERVTDADDFKKNLLSLAGNESLRKERSTRLVAYLNERLGASTAYVDLLLNKVN